MEEVEDLGMRRGNAAGADFPPLSGCIHASAGRPILLYDTDTGGGLLAERFEADSKTGEAGADDNHVVWHFPSVTNYYIGNTADECYQLFYWLGMIPIK